MPSEKVVATILTRNRKDLLRQALDAAKRQTRPVDQIIVVDNESNDGTLEMLGDEFPEVTVVKLPENRGATGGFYEAIAAARRTDAGWYWLLDDDSIARPAALAELLDAIERIGGDAPPALMCSRVVWRDGDPHVMNRPVVRRRGQREIVRAVRNRMLPVRAATWVSLLLSRDAVERSGMPPVHFFYQADDIEYTARILRDARGYYVPESVVEHRTPTQHTAVDDDHRFYYHARNTVLMLRGSAWRWREKPTFVWFLVYTSLVYLRKNRLSPKSVRTLVGGLVAGVRSPLQ
jgi:rhamnopyranosyl-N-acetylglucosaminyl-diphospho-decaprenol beta-1,3/1,4-galactofuranosyltransferase